MRIQSATIVTMDALSASSAGDPGAASGEGDAQLAAQSLLGDREAFGRLIARHEDSVFRLAWRILRSREDAEDAAQEAMLRAWRSLGRYDSSRPFRSWALRIAWNVALTELARRRGRAAARAQDVDLESLPEPPGHSPAAAAARNEARDQLAEAIGCLSASDAALFHLRYGEDLPLGEIALITGRAPGAVAVALNRLRARLRQRLSEDSRELP